jgi:hypothetical protein
MAVIRDVTLTYGGCDYVVTPTNRLMRRIEAEDGINLVQLALDLARAKAKASTLAYVGAELLKAGGAKVTEDDVRAFIMGPDVAEVRNFLTSVMSAIMPTEDEGKKPEALAK